MKMHNPGEIINRRYEIVKPIGGGAFGNVYLIDDSSKPGTKMALKEMSIEGLPEPERSEAVGLFTREAEILRSLNHEGLPGIADFFTIESSHYIVMEYIEGETLEQKLKSRNGPFTCDEVLSWTEELCDILEYLHTRRPEPVIFRDLKPSNIMVTADGRVKLIDFGIARHYSPGKVKDTYFMGTPGFSPPEQYGKGQSDERSDIFAFGATLYHLLSRADMAQYSVKFPPLSSLSPSVPKWLEAVIMSCLSVNPGERYQSIALLKDDLKRGSSNPGTGGAVFSPCTVAAVQTAPVHPAPVNPAMKRKQILIITLIAFGFMLVIGLCLFVILRDVLGKDHFESCKKNLRDMGTAFEMYSSDNLGRYPVSIDMITPHYMTMLPRCPAAGKVTYSYTYTQIPDCYTVWCSGDHHSGYAGHNFPEYDAASHT